MLTNVESLRFLDRIPIHDCGEPLVDVRSLKARVVVREGILPVVRLGVAQRLAEASVALPKGLRLYVVRGFRSLDVQREKWEGYRNQLRTLHPSWPLAVLNREANKVFAPCHHKTPPGHSTGAAVDVVLIDEEGEFLDVVPPLTDWKLGYTNSVQVSMEQQSCRAVLKDIMERQGFSNYPREYWHYSYGDSAWAARTGSSTAIYGAFTEPLELQVPN